MYFQIRKSVLETMLWNLEFVCGFLKEYNRMTKYIYNKVLLQNLNIFDWYLTNMQHEVSTPFYVK